MIMHVYISNLKSFIMFMFFRIYLPHIMVKLFGSFNEIDSQNKYIKSVLSLEKLWVTQCDWLWLCTMVAILITVNIFWKLFHRGIKR